MCAITSQNGTAPKPKARLELMPSSSILASNGLYSSLLY